MKKQTKVWTTRDGRRIRICDMTDDHLFNTLRMLKRKAIQFRLDVEATTWAAAGSFNGEMASYYAEQEAERVSDSDWTDFVPSIFWNMVLDMHRRGGEVEGRGRELLG